MNRDHISGGIKQGIGKIKEDVGHAVGDESLAGEGVVDRVKGKVQETFGDIKDAVKEKVDDLLDKKKAS